MTDSTGPVSPENFIQADEVSTYEASSNNWQLRGQLQRGVIISILVGGLLAAGYQSRLLGGFSWLSQLIVMAVWQPLAWFMGGWLIGIVIWWADDRWSQRWYDSSPITRSVGFSVVLWVVSVIVVTTTGSGLGIGLVLSLLTSLLGEVWIWQAQPVAFRQRFLHDIRPEALERLEHQWQGKWGSVVGLGWLIAGALLFI